MENKYRLEYILSISAMVLVGLILLWIMLYQLKKIFKKLKNKKKWKK